MRHRALAAIVAAALFAASVELVRTLTVAAVSPVPSPAGAAEGRDEAAEKVRAGLGRLPVSFVANQGRWDDRASWVASGSEATAYFVDGGVRWALAGRGDQPGWALDQALVGARSARPTASVPATGVVSYFVGEHHHAGLPTATELTLAQAWPGVDVVWSGTSGRIEATYRLAPGADPGQVRVAWRGADALAVTAAGTLSVSTPVRSFVEDAPKAFQEVDGTRVPVEVAFELDGRDGYGFRLGSYDATRPLRIDPTTLLYAGFLGGGAEDIGFGIAVDGAGNALVTGRTSSTATTFPDTPGVFRATNAGGDDAFVAKVNASGSALLYAGFLGGAGSDIGRAIAVDGSGNAYVTGSTDSPAATFPDTPGVFQAGNAGNTDAFVAKVNPTGSALTYAGFLGGSNTESGLGIAVDGAGNAYVTGETRSTAVTFPVTVGVFQGSNGGGLDGGSDAFVAKVNPSGSALTYAGFLGGNGAELARAIAVDGGGNAYLTGQTASAAATFPDTPGVFQPGYAGATDAFVAKVNPTGSALVYAGFLGGGGLDIGRGIAVDGGNAYVTGSTNSAAATFPDTPGVFQAANAGDFDGFVAKVNPTGSALVYAGFLGGGGSDISQGIAVDGAGNAHLTGWTTSAASTFPDTPGAFQAANAGAEDAFVAKVNPSGSALVYASFLGGSGFDEGSGIAVDGAGIAYVTGWTGSSAATFPDTPGVFQGANAGGNDVFVAKIATSTGAPGDFDGSGSSDIGVFRDSTATWYLRTGTPASITWGATGDIPVPGDYDGDGNTDEAVFRPSNSVWYLGSSPTASIPWGATGDIPVPADFDGDGKTDIAVFRPSTSVWYLRTASPASIPWGANGDIPAPGDYDGDGTADLGVFRPSTNVWYLRTTVPLSVPWGAAGDIPVPGDYDGDGEADIAVFRPASATWFLRTLTPTSIVWGAGGDVPVPGDYDGNGAMDVALYRPSTSVWYIGTPTPSSPSWGAPGDIPLPLPYAVRRVFFP